MFFIDNDEKMKLWWKGLEIYINIFSISYLNIEVNIILLIRRIKKTFVGKQKFVWHNKNEQTVSGTYLWWWHKTFSHVDTTLRRRRIVISSFVFYWWTVHRRQRHRWCCRRNWWRCHGCDGRLPPNVGKFLTWFEILLQVMGWNAR